MPEASVPAAFERWERPAPPIGRRDIGLSVVVGILAIGFSGLLIDSAIAAVADRVAPWRGNS